MVFRNVNLDKQSFTETITGLLKVFGARLESEGLESPQEEVTYSRLISSYALDISLRITLEVQSGMKTVSSQYLPSKSALSFKDLIIHSKALRRLRFDLDYISYQNMLHYTNAKVQEYFATSKREDALYMDLGWELPSFCQQELERDSSLNLALSVTGIAQAAWAARCYDYLYSFWPRTCSAILDVIEGMRQKDFVGKAYLILEIV